MRMRAMATAASLSVLFGTVPIQAAELGGNCCADLEDRIAELEATTARKGNRKVKLTVSGSVNEALMAWDDGFEKNAYVVTNETRRTRLTFSGQAKITEDVSAGYVLELGPRGDRMDRKDQKDGSVNAGTVDHHQFVVLEHPQGFFGESQGTGAEDQHQHRQQETGGADERHDRD